MYKTVRHGENSLQYTILPQTEEVLNNSGLKGKGRDYSPSIHIRRSRRRSTAKYVLLVFFGIIIALALASVPLYVMNGALYARRNLRERGDAISVTSSPVVPTGRDIVKSRKKELQFQELSLNVRLDTTSTSLPTTTVATTTLRNEISIPPVIRIWKSSTSVPTLPAIPMKHHHDDIPLLGKENDVSTFDAIVSKKPWDSDTIIRPTVTPEPVTFRTLTSSPSIHSDKVNIVKFEDVLISTKPSIPIIAQTTESTSEGSNFKDLKDSMLDDEEEFKDSLEVDEVFSLPPLKPDFAAPGLDTDDVIVSKTNDNSWYGARWPFVDTSSYFQWTGYSPGDNLLLPLLVAAVSSVALVLLLALAVRRRKRSYTASAQIGKLTADLQADDNTNLLTAENPEEPEE